MCKMINLNACRYSSTCLSYLCKKVFQAIYILSQFISKNVFILLAHMNVGYGIFAPQYFPLKVCRHFYTIFSHYLKQEANRIFAFGGYFTLYFLKNFVMLYRFFLMLYRFCFCSLFFFLKMILYIWSWKCLTSICPSGFCFAYDLKCTLNYLKYLSEIWNICCIIWKLPFFHWFSFFKGDLLSLDSDISSSFYIIFIGFNFSVVRNNFLISFTILLVPVSAESKLLLTASIMALTSILLLR